MRFVPFVFVLAALLVSSLSARAEDSRLEPLKDLNGYFPFNSPASLSEWNVRKEHVRRQILVAAGLWPMPTKTPLNAVIHGRIDRGEYTIEKVYFESVPGFFVTGNLYRPKNVKGKAPAVMFAHGHRENARFYLAPEEKLRKDIADGAERFERAGRSTYQSMSRQLALMGCIVWQWDMLSDSDSIQLPREVVRRFAKQRPEMNTTAGWGLYSPQAEAHLQSIMGLQTLNSTRGLDFLLSLPEVDPQRIAITGGSGGGTQTMLLAAIDDRVRLSFPVVMVSTAMQGGCTCENASLLRVNTGNVEFAALKLVQGGATVVGADLFLQGGEPVRQTRVVANPREFAGYTFGYNHALFAQRTHDVLSIVSLLRNSKSGSPANPRTVAVAGWGSTGPIVVAARALAGPAIDRAAADTGGFRFGQVLDYRDPMFLPGGAMCLDLPGMMALGAPHPLWLAGEGQGPDIAAAAYRSASKADELCVFTGEAGQKETAAIQWLLKWFPYAA